MALPGDHGRDDDLGALGLHAPGRLDQPRRDDVVQPLRARRGRRLAAPHGRRPRPGRAGLPAAAGRAASRAGHHLGGGDARDAVRDGGGVLDPSDGTAFALEVTVPPNTTAEVVLPDGSAPVEVGSGRHSFSCDDPGAGAGREAGVFVLQPGRPPVTRRPAPVGPPPPYDAECGAVLAAPPAVPAADGRGDPVPAGGRVHPAADERGARPRRGLHRASDAAAGRHHRGAGHHGRDPPTAHRGHSRQRRLTMLRPQDGPTRERKRLDGLWRFRLDPAGAGRDAGLVARAAGRRPRHAGAGQLQRPVRRRRRPRPRRRRLVPDDGPRAPRLGRPARGAPLRRRHPPRRGLGRRRRGRPARGRLHAVRGRRHRARRARARSSASRSSSTTG